MGLVYSISHWWFYGTILSGITRWLSPRYLSRCCLWCVFSEVVDCEANCFSQLAYTVALTLHLAEILFNPPASLPDFYPVLNVLLSAGIFGLSWLWSIKRLVEISWAMGPLGSSVQPTRTDRKILEPPG